MSEQAPSAAAPHRAAGRTERIQPMHNGSPGPRPDYGPHYYAGLVIDPDGHRIEAVINAPQEPGPYAQFDKMTEDAPVELVPYSLRWPVRYAEEAALLRTHVRAALDAWRASRRAAL